MDKYGIRPIHDAAAVVVILLTALALYLGA
jgi:hypothetical protein